MLVFGRRLERMPVTPSLLSGQALSASFGSGSTAAEILRYAQDDRQDSVQVLSREVFSPNVWVFGQHNSTHALANELLGF